MVAVHASGMADSREQQLQDSSSSREIGLKHWPFHAGTAAYMPIVLACAGAALPVQLLMISPCK